MAKLMGRQVKHRLRVYNYCSHHSETTSVVSYFQKEILKHFLLSGKYFLYVCCFFAGDWSFLLNMRSALVLFNSTWLMPSDTMTFICLSNSILLSKCSQINPFFFPLYVETPNFLFLTMASAVHSWIKLHRNKLQWDAVPTIRAKRKCCQGQQEKMKIYAN